MISHTFTQGVNIIHLKKPLFVRLFGFDGYKKHGITIDFVYNP